MSANPVATDNALSIANHPTIPAASPRHTGAARSPSIAAARNAASIAQPQPSVTAPISPTAKRKGAVIATGSPPMDASSHREGASVAANPAPHSTAPNATTATAHPAIQRRQNIVIASAPNSCSSCYIAKIRSRRYTGMGTRDDKRTAAVERVADHLLAHGLEGAGLRALAAAAGTSDRMLLYYFRDKDDLVAAALERVAARLTTALDGAIPAGGRKPYAPLLAAIWEAVGSPELSPYMRLWLELAGDAARGREPQRAVAAAILDGFARWVADRLDGLPAEAALLLATVDGLLFLDAAGRRDLADLAVSAAR